MEGGAGAVSNRFCWRTLSQCGAAYAEGGGGARCAAAGATECGGAANKRSKSRPTSKSSRAKFSCAASNKGYRADGKDRVPKLVRL